MIKRDTPVENALVLHPRFANTRARDADYDLEEAIGLADALGVITKASRIVPVRDLKVSNFFVQVRLQILALSLRRTTLAS